MLCSGQLHTFYRLPVLCQFPSTGTHITSPAFPAPCPGMILSPSFNLRQYVIMTLGPIQLHHQNHPCLIVLRSLLSFILWLDDFGILQCLPLSLIQTHWHIEPTLSPSPHTMHVCEYSLHGYISPDVNYLPTIGFSLLMLHALGCVFTLLANKCSSSKSLLSLPCCVIRGPDPFHVFLMLPPECSSPRLERTTLFAILFPVIIMMHVGGAFLWRARWHQMLRNPSSQLISLSLIFQIFFPGCVFPSASSILSVLPSVYRPEN